MIPVSQPYLPPEEEYQELISKLWNIKWLTNNGPYVQELEASLMEYLGIPSLYFVNNGTIALQIALKALNIEGEVITTPFSFVATTTSLIWEKCSPVFVDIDPRTLCINPDKIEEAITDKTKAILATHVYGIPCDVERIEQIAKEFNLKVIYDAAHAFGVRYKEKSILNYGDISTLSFHATKLYHTVEGGGIVNNKETEIGDKIDLIRSFGIKGNEHRLPGINGKNSEFHAAMGICNLKYIKQIIQKRKEIHQIYESHLNGVFERPVMPASVEYNYAYYPLIFETEAQLLDVKERLKNHNIETRRYFYPSLNQLPYISSSVECKFSESISKRVLCIPLYSDLRFEDAEKIANTILERR